MGVCNVSSVSNVCRRRSSTMLIEHRAHIVDLCQIFQERNEIEQFSVIHVVEPAVDGHRVVRMEHVGRGRVIDDDDVGQFPAELREVL